jgi:hypothetical protein
MDNRNPQELQDERAVRSEPLETEDGRTVVIEQQNAGPGNQVGGGEFKNVSGHKSVDEAAAEQADLECDAPVETSTYQRTHRQRARRISDHRNR